MDGTFESAGVRPSGSAKADGREPNSFLGRVSSVKLDRFVMYSNPWHIQACPSLELITWPRFHLVIVSLSMVLASKKLYHFTPQNFNCLRTWLYKEQVAANSLKLPSLQLIECLTKYYKKLKVNKQFFVCIHWQQIRIPINQQLFEVDRILTNRSTSVKKWDQTIYKFS